MQPFDSGGLYDKRYDDVFSHAITDAGLEPYRVDRDPSVSIPIDHIELGIRNSDLCLAEITTDNPNVWFELGYAMAVPKEVVLVCSSERTSKFPFDVQHRAIITYKTESVQDFTQLKGKITARIKAILEKSSKISNAAAISPVADTEGLSHHELVALVSIQQNSFLSCEGVTPYTIQEDMRTAGFTNITISLALESLSQKGMIMPDSTSNFHGEKYRVYDVTPPGFDWLFRNQNLLDLKIKPVTPPDFDLEPF
jgi:hypothetical protein